GVAGLSTDTPLSFPPRDTCQLGRATGKQRSGRSPQERGPRAPKSRPRVPKGADRTDARQGPETWAGVLYLAVGLEAGSGRIIGWAMEAHLRTELDIRGVHYVVEVLTLIYMVAAILSLDLSF